MEELNHLNDFRKEISAAQTTLRRPVCQGWIGDYQITGSRGHVLSDGDHYYIYHFARSKAGWTNAKRALGFGDLRQDGDEEGVFRLDRLPTPDEGRVIRRRLGIRVAGAAPTNAFRSSAANAGG